MTTKILIDFIVKFYKWKQIALMCIDGAIIDYRIRSKKKSLIKYYTYTHSSDSIRMSNAIRRVICVWIVFKYFGEIQQTNRQKKTEHT